MTDPWWLSLGALCGGTRSYGATLNNLVALQDFLAEDEADGKEASVRYLREQRRHTVLDFLENPGYANEAQLRWLRKEAADVLSEPALEKFLAGRWPQHLAVLRVETFLHIAAVVCTALACVIAFGGLGHLLPTALTATIALAWGTLVYIELIWCGSPSGTIRRMFLPNQSVGGIAPRDQLRLVVRGLRFWRRPVAWLFVLLLTSPLLTARRGRTAGAAR